MSKEYARSSKCEMKELYALERIIRFSQLSSGAISPSGYYEERFLENLEFNTQSYFPENRIALLHNILWFELTSSPWGCAMWTYTQKQFQEGWFSDSPYILPAFLLPQECVACGVNLNLTIKTYNQENGRDNTVKFKCRNCADAWKGIKRNLSRFVNEHSELLLESKTRKEVPNRLYKAIGYEWEIYQILAKMLEEKFPYTPRFKLFQEYENLEFDWLQKLLCREISLKELELPIFRPNIRSKILHFEPKSIVLLPKKHKKNEITLLELQRYFITPQG